MTLIELVRVACALWEDEEKTLLIESADGGILFDSDTDGKESIPRGLEDYAVNCMYDTDNGKYVIQISEDSDRLVWDTCKEDYRTIDSLKQEYVRMLLNGDVSEAVSYIEWFKSCESSNKYIRGVKP